LPDYELKLNLDNVIFTRRDGGTMGQAISAPPSPALRSAAEPAHAPALDGSIAGALASFSSAIESGKRKIALSLSALERVPELAPGWDKYFPGEPVLQLGCGQGDRA